MNDPIAESLALAADRCGDPAPLIYARLFAAHPEMEALFVRDTSGHVRGHMLAMVIDTLLSLPSNPGYTANMVQAEFINHQGLGVPPDLFQRFFTVIMETVRDVLGTGWTPDFEFAWQRTLDDLAGITSEMAA